MTAATGIQPNAPVTPRRSARTPTTAAASVTVTLALAALAWVFAVRQMNEMDMRLANGLGSLASFSAMWVSMMAAMMLPGAGLAIWNHVLTAGRLQVVPLFLEQ